MSKEAARERTDSVALGGSAVDGLTVQVEAVIVFDNADPTNCVRRIAGTARKPPSDSRRRVTPLDSRLSSSHPAAAECQPNSVIRRRNGRSLVGLGPGAGHQRRRFSDDEEVDGGHAPLDVSQRTGPGETNVDC